ncbi:hypothetical protein [Planomonospora parontospora]|uniref:hypothetical protein n=1 Tax=Planomonospora parontospora TaxID=58119 RepID=UPI00166FA026|nr:hypothetical protein [Planomonospora parontospora]GGL51595.1 hypothetical protein GCM10014719_61140 [Planomonospora parontospora subsp. antibiotica]GII19614.1 hypothetical protein Ppa05_63400 [Planomonospora parontospora subsp. antibiotica]
MDVSASADGTGAVNLLDLTDGSPVSAGDGTASGDSDTHSEPRTGASTAYGSDSPHDGEVKEDIEPDFWGDDEKPRRFSLAPRTALLVGTGVLVIITVAVIMFFLGRDRPPPPESAAPVPSVPVVQEPDPVVVEPPPPPVISEPPSPPPVKPRATRRAEAKSTVPPPPQARVTSAPSRPPVRRTPAPVARLTGAPTAAPPPPDAPGQGWPARPASAPPPPAGRPPLTVSATAVDLSAARTAPLVLAAREPVSWSISSSAGLVVSATAGTLTAGQSATVVVGAAPSPAGAPPAGCGQARRGSVTVQWSGGADPARTAGTHTVAVALWVPCR